MQRMNYTRPRIGRILRDGGFLSSQDLKRALGEQATTNERLGEVLVRMGLLDSGDLNAALSVQAHLGDAGDAVAIAAGDRRKLGELLVQSGRITEIQLKLALAEQARSGEMLGKCFVRLGLLTEQQLIGLLDFQRVQGMGSLAPGPLRLGELLVSTGCISRIQLDEALRKQIISRKQLGEVLIEEGYAQPHHVKQGMRLQQMLLTAALVSLLSACGGDNLAVQNSISNAPIAAADQAASASNNYFKIVSSDYEILEPTFYYSTNNEKFWSIQASVARDVWDPEWRSIVRIDILKPETGEMPALNQTFSIEENPLYERFQGTFFVFNGEQSVHKKVEQGVISFSADSAVAGSVRGSFEVTLTDYDSAVVPPPRYHLSGSFFFKVGSYGPASPQPDL